MNYEKNQTIIKLLSECVNECSYCASACLEEQDVKMLARCIKLNIDCAEICNLAASYLSRESENIDRIINQCAEICEICAKECEKHKHMEHCKRCAEKCRACAEACSAAILKSV
ncbi:MAG: four-helix bundle copper-binding protein [Bacteroidetes bacterium]|nr:four-helix bundle copper-binding protein [Bacteroidota bacterium]